MDGAVEAEAAPAAGESNGHHGTLVELPIESVRECSSNPRTRFDAQAMAELTQSVREHGVITPLIVRAVPAKKTKPGGYEIAAGHRRYRAAKAAGLKRIPAVVRAMTEEQFVELLNIENLQRQDLDPLEEAEGFRQLLELPGRDVAGVAVRVSRTPRYVYDRVGLTRLEPAARELLVGGEITVSHAILLSRLTPADQARTIEDGLFTSEQTQHGFWTKEEDHRRKPVSVRELEDWIDARLRFDCNAVDRVVHPETHATLFGALSAEDPERVVEICALHQTPATARAEQRTYCRASWARADGEPDRFEFGRKVKASKKCESSCIGVIVVGPGRGESFRVCVDKKGCRTHWPESKKPRAAGAQSGKSPSNDKWKAQEAKREQDRKLWEGVLPAVSEAMHIALASADTTPAGAVGMVIASLLDRHMKKPKPFEGKTADDLVRAIASKLLEEELDNSSWDAGRDLEPIAKLLGVKLDKFRAQATAAANGTAPKKTKGATSKAKSAKRKTKARAKRVEAIDEDATEGDPLDS